MRKWAGGWAGCLLIGSACLAAVGCVDEHRKRPDPPQRPDASDAEVSDGGDAAPDGESSMPDTGPAADGGDAETELPDTGPPPPIKDTIGQPCTTDTECDNGDFCDGRELCVLDVDESGHSCVRGQPPCAAAACVYPARRCDCSYRGGDADGDNRVAIGCDGNDCDDDNIDVHPGIAERCDDVDDDCNPKTYGEADEDHDMAVSHLCRNVDPASRKWIAGPDPDDQRSDVYPDAVELCDGVDNDCDHAIDETGDGRSGGLDIVFYRDRDGDGFGGEKARGDDRLQAHCNTPPNKLWSLQATDCDDTDPLVHPGRQELCNGRDDNCKDGDDEEPFDEKPDFTGATLTCRGVNGWEITCPATEGNCNQDVSDGCETPLDTLCDCRACGSVCRFACGAAACQEITAFSIGGSHTCAITGTSGEIVACWGANHRGQVGDDSINQATLPKRVERLSGVLQVAAGGDHSCAIAADGGKLFCWGDDHDGQLGSPASNDHSMIPVPVGGLAGGQLSGVISVAAGEQHSCAILNGGKLACWGRGNDGRLGDAQPTTEHIALGPIETFRVGTQEPIRDAKQVVAGYAHTCLLTTRATVECAGDNSFNQLGDGMLTPSSSRFQPVPGLEAVDELSAGWIHTCARTRGRVVCWGSNAYGQLGVAASSSLPTEVPGLERIRSIAMGGWWSCAIDADDLLRCWGSNDYGQLANPNIPVDYEPHPTPQVTSVGKVRAVFGGYGPHVCALTSDARALCWGSNDSGELGTGGSAQGGMPIPQSVRALAGSASCSH